MLGERVTGDVGFLKQREPRDASAGKLMPDGFSNGMEIHFFDQAVEQSAQCGAVGDGCRVALMSFNDPLAA